MLSSSPTYSICCTNYGNAGTIRASMESLISQTDERFEIIVVDSFSRDGALEILSDLERQGKIRLITEQSNRGRGRQIALEASRGKYSISQIDMDDIYKPCFRRLLEFYHQKHEGLALLLSGAMVAPRELLVKVGGWRDLQWGEDRDIWFRISKTGKLAWVRFEVRESIGPPAQKTHIRRVRERYEKARDSTRLGLDPFAEIAKGRLSTPFYLAVSALGSVRARFSKRYYRNELRGFDYRKFGSGDARVDL